MKHLAQWVARGRAQWMADATVIRTAGPRGVREPCPALLAHSNTRAPSRLMGAVWAGSGGLHLCCRDLGSPWPEGSSGVLRNEGSSHGAWTESQLGQEEGLCAARRVLSPGRAALTETSAPEGGLAAGKSLDSGVGRTWVQIPALLWELGQVTLPL